MLASAFETGLHTPAAPTPASVGWEFLCALQAGLNTRLSPADQEYFWEMYQRVGDAFEAARRDQLEQARRGFDSVGNDMCCAPASCAARRLVQAFLLAARAYLDYRLGQYDLAERQVRHASLIDDRIVGELDLDIMSAHRVQLAHNLLRVSLRRGNAEDAIELAGAFLDYLELGVECAFSDLACPPARLRNVGEGLSSYWFDRFCGDVAVAAAGRMKPHTDLVLERLAPHAERQSCAEGAFASQAHGWLACVSVLARGDIDQFTETAAPALRAGRQAEPALWFATVAESARVCRTFGPEGARIANSMATQCASLPGAPSELTWP